MKDDPLPIRVLKVTGFVMINITAMIGYLTLFMLMFMTSSKASNIEYKSSDDTKVNLVNQVAVNCNTERIYEPSKPKYNYAPTNASQSEVIAIINQVFGADAPKMIQVAKYESGFNPDARNPSGASGILQIMPATWRGYNCTGNIFNTYDNAICGKKVLQGQGWYAWHVVSVYNL